MTRLPLCVLARADTFTLAGAGGGAGGGVVVGGRLLDHDNYCISGARAWYCKQAWNRWASYTASSRVLTNVKIGENSDCVHRCLNEIFFSFFRMSHSNLCEGLLFV